jgi:hypothetical protein
MIRAPFPVERTSKAAPPRDLARTSLFFMRIFGLRGGIVQKRLELTNSTIMTGVAR